MGAEYSNPLSNSFHSIARLLELYILGNYIIVNKLIEPDTIEKLNEYRGYIVKHELHNAAGKFGCRQVTPQEVHKAISFLKEKKCVNNFEFFVINYVPIPILKFQLFISYFCLSGAERRYIPYVLYEITDPLYTESAKETFDAISWYGSNSDPSTVPDSVWGLSREVFYKCWNAIRSADLFFPKDDYKYSVIDKILVQYAQEKKSFLDFLSDYEKMLLKPECENMNILRNMPPHTVIQRAMYDFRNNDNYVFEMEYVYRQFWEIIDEGESILIINPCTECVVKPNENSEYVLLYRTVASLYQKEFPNKKFYCMEDLMADCNRETDSNQKKLEYDKILLFTSSIRDKKKISSAINLAIRACKKNGKLLMLLPKATSTNQYLKEILHNKCTINTVLSVTPKVSPLFNMKQMLVWIDKKDCIGYESCNLFESSVLTESELPLEMNLQNHVFFVNGEYRDIANRQLEGNLSIGELFRNTKMPIKRGAKTYPLSKELNLEYTIGFNKRLRERSLKIARDFCLIRELHVNYYAILKESDTRRKAGNCLTDKVNKIIYFGNQASSNEVLYSALEELAWNEKIIGHIATDVRRNYDNLAGDNISLKTLMFGCADILLKQKSFKKETALALFAGADRSLANLIPSQTSEQDYENVVREIAAEGKCKETECWRLLNSIFSIAVKNKLVSRNPILEIINKNSGRASTNIRKVRKRLIKRQFTPKEEKIILNKLFEDTKLEFGDRLAKLYEVDSHWLALAIRLYTGMTVKEICALKWQDYVRIKGSEDSQFKVVRYISEDRYVEEYSMSEKLRRRRLVPVVCTLSEMLENRKRYLLKSFDLTEETILQYPIIFDLEVGGRHKITHCRKKYCNVNKITKVEKEMIAALNISPQNISLADPERKSTDLSVYGGDIFYSNWKFKANYICGLTDGEISYILGIKPQSVLDTYYCDYGQQALQSQMAKKLRRWTAKQGVLLNENSSPRLLKKVNLKPGNCITHIVEPYGNGLTATELLIKPEQENASGTYTISFDSRYGNEGYIVAFDWGN